MANSTNLNGKRKVTQADVAKAAGVSTATVSLAMNDSDAITAVTRDKIIDLAIKMGYEPNSSYFRYINTLLAEQSELDSKEIAKLKKSDPEAVEVYELSTTARGGISAKKMAKIIGEKFSISQDDAIKIARIVLNVRELAVTTKRVNIAMSILRTGKTVISNSTTAKKQPENSKKVIADTTAKGKTTGKPTTK